jgi:hypothetical protein
MKICKRIVSLLVIAAMLAFCIPAFAAEDPEYPEAPEGYDGYVTFAVSALTMGWTYIVDPVLVPVNEGESVAAVTARAFDMLEWEYNYSGSIESGFYLTGIGCYETDPMVPDYLMTEILNYPAWAEENFGMSFGEWTGTYTDDGILSAGEYCTLSGWMYTENNVDTGEGADAHTVTIGAVYTWIYSIYGWGMDFGISDGWGSFPVFDNPMEGVDRTRVSRALAILSADEEIVELIGEDEDIMMIAFDLLNAFYTCESSQEMLDEYLDALLEALYGGSAVLLGDVNFDGEITASDALLVMRHGMELQELSEEALAVADMNEDEVIDLADALLILRAAMA